jgi:hypothetical protein
MSDSNEYTFKYQWVGTVYIHLNPATRLSFLRICKRFLEIGLLTLPPWSIYVSKETGKMDCGLWHACRNNHVKYYNKWKKIANNRWPCTQYLKSSLLNCVDRNSLGSSGLFRTIIEDTSYDIMTIYPEVFVEACVSCAMIPIGVMFERNKVPCNGLIKIAIHNTLSSRRQNVQEALKLLVARKECNYTIFCELLSCIESGIDVDNKPIEVYQRISQFRSLINCDMSKFGNPTGRLRGLLAHFRDTPEYTQILTERYTYYKLILK